jgi:hypothetical protein
VEGRRRRAPAGRPRSAATHDPPGQGATVMGMGENTECRGRRVRARVWSGHGIGLPSYAHIRRGMLQQRVVRLDVAVHDAARVGVAKRPGRRRAGSPRSRAARATGLRQPAAQRLPGGSSGVRCRLRRPTSEDLPGPSGDHSLACSG